MLIDNKLITQRPKVLFDSEFYTQMPDLPTAFSYKTLPSFLNFDMFQLFGIMPKTMDLIGNTQIGFIIQPTAKEVEYYKKRNTRFQLISIVANVHTIKRDSDQSAVAFPYSISLIAGQKRGEPDSCNIELLSKLDLEKISNRKHVYTDFSPFKPVEEGFYADMSFIADPNIESFTDTIGFVLESYFLPMDIDVDDALISSPTGLSKEIEAKFKKVRVKRYFTPFSDVKPRKIWGCDSPIELFLVQGLAQKDLFPQVQTVIFKDGEVYDNFYQMMHDNIFRKGDEIISEADAYFPDKKLAVFCDSNKYHRGVKNKQKDLFIDEQLNKHNITVLRFQGKQIINDLEECVKKIENKLNEL